MDILLLTLLVVASAMACVSMSVRYFRHGVWVVSPPVVLIAYFLGASLFGVIQASVLADTVRALIAHALWFTGMAVALAILFVLSSGRSFSMPSISIIRNLGGLWGNRQVFLLFILLGVVAVIFTFIAFGRIPLFIGLGALVSGDGNLSMHEARQMNTLSHRSGDTIYFGQGYLRKIFTVVSPVFCAALYLVSKSELAPERRRSRLAVLLFFAFVLFGALNGQIWVGLQVWIYFALIIIFAKIWESRGGEVNKLVYGAARVYIALLGFIFAYRYLQVISGRTIADDWFTNTVNRIWGFKQIRLFEIFPDIQPFRYGSTWLNDLAGILPGPSESFAYEAHYLIHGGGWGFTASPGIIASSYLNFGYIGVFLASIVFTLIFVTIFTSLMSSRSAVKIALGILVSVRFAFGLPGDFVPYMVDFMTIIVIYGVYALVNGMLSRRHQRLNGTIRYN